MVDDYVGYKVLFTAGPTELACLARIRRKIYDVHASSGSPVTEEVLRRVWELYAIQQQSAGMMPNNGAHCVSSRLTALAELHARPLATQRSATAGSSTPKAIEHALKRWPALQHSASSGNLPIDNNPIENAIRRIAIEEMAVR